MNCACGCGREVEPTIGRGAPRIYASATCRNRVFRRNHPDQQRSNARLWRKRIEEGRPRRKNCGRSRVEVDVSKLSAFVADSGKSQARLSVAAGYHHSTLSVIRSRGFANYFTLDAILSPFGWRVEDVERIPSESLS